MQLGNIVATATWALAAGATITIGLINLPLMVTISTKMFSYFHTATAYRTHGICAPFPPTHSPNKAAVKAGLHQGSQSPDTNTTPCLETQHTFHSYHLKTDTQETPLIAALGGN